MATILIQRMGVSREKRTTGGQEPLSQRTRPRHVSAQRRAPQAIDESLVAGDDPPLLRHGQGEIQAVVHGAPRRATQFQRQGSQIATGRGFDRQTPHIRQHVSRFLLRDQVASASLPDDIGHFRVQKIGRQNFRNMETFLIAAAFYWILTVVFQFLQGKLEDYMARGERR